MIKKVEINGHWYDVVDQMGNCICIWDDISNTYHWFEVISPIISEDCIRELNLDNNE